MNTLLSPVVWLWLLSSVVSTVHAAIVDPAGDFLPSYAFEKNGDLDALSADVIFDKPANTFTLTGTMNGAVGAETPSAAYVFGFDRGQGAPLLAAIASNVLFDSVVIVNANGTGSVIDIVNGNAMTLLPAGSVHSNGNTITATFSASLIPSLNLLTPEQYTWNLWPRFAAVLTDNYVSDFAPDNSNVAVHTVPEPSTWTLLVAGISIGLMLYAYRARSETRQAFGLS